ncbi:MAG: DUF4430 domain-containing protein, partial [Solirubrobacteraceae bacterium]
RPLRARRPGRGAVATLAAALAAVSLAGCGLGAGPAPKGVSLLVTQGFGAVRLLSTSRPKLGGAETVISLLQRNAKVGTRYSGGFVTSIDGHAEARGGGSSSDWFYYVNGLEASKGAADTEVSEGDHVWWDLHDWSATDHIPAIVGAFPQPFLDGLAGKKFPVRIGCANPRARACHAISQRLGRLGVIAGFGAIGPTLEAPETLDVLVGTWSELKSSPAAHLIERGPSRSGVYVKVVGGGKAFVLLDPAGKPTQSLSSGAGLVAATTYPDEGPVWVVTGTDQAGLMRAVDAFDAATLDGHFAVVVSPEGRAISIPQTSG